MAIDKSTLTAGAQHDLEQILEPTASIQDLMTSPEVSQGKETPLNVPKWVWVFPLLSVKAAFLAYLAGVPLVPTLFFGMAPIVLIPLLIFLLYCATGAGAAVLSWLTKTRKEGG